MALSDPRSRWSIHPTDSMLSINSKGSVLSVGSVGSVASVDARSQSVGPPSHPRLRNRYSRPKAETTSSPMPKT